MCAHSYYSAVNQKTKELHAENWHVAVTGTTPPSTIQFIETTIRQHYVGGD